MVVVVIVFVAVDSMPGKVVGHCGAASVLAIRRTRETIRKKPVAAIAVTLMRLI